MPPSFADCWKNRASVPVPSAGEGAWKGLKEKTFGYPWTSPNIARSAGSSWPRSSGPGRGAVLAAGVGADGDWRGPGGYYSWVKLLAFWLLFLAWVRTADWINRDAQAMKLELLRWNPVVFGSFLGGVFLFF